MEYRSDSEGGRELVRSEEWRVVMMVEMGRGDWERWGRRRCAV